MLMGWAGLIFFIIVIGGIYEMFEKGEKIQEDNYVKEQEEVERKQIDNQIENDRIRAINENLKLTNQIKRSDNSLSSQQILFGLISIVLGVVLTVLFFKNLYIN